ncbi:sensor histidine kinase [Sphingorhabdus sp.]|jgi:signal transduction histidine kinase|uniref:sensor histidine kinase n=1 Tax=Sphingorhabdus sp. TaxID=1902408 RepID=UPI003D818044
MRISNQVLNRLPTAVILLTWPLARILLCIIIFLALSVSPAELIFTKSLQYYFYAFLGWTAATTLLAVGGQLLQPNVLRAQVAGDTILILCGIILLQGTEMATIPIMAFAVCVGAIAMTIGLKGKHILAAIAFAVFMFLLRSLAVQLSGTPLLPIIALSELSEAISQLMMLIAMGMVMISASRKYRLKLFSIEFSSLHTLSLEKSFEFDLQAWTNASASLFGPQQAACLVQGPAQYATGQYHQCNMPILQKEQEREKLLNALRNLPIGYSLFDTRLNRVICPDTGRYRSFDENEQRIAHVLRRADIKAALVQPLQIDHMRGGFICAVNNHIDAVLLAEAAFIGRHVTEMSAYLGKVAIAQRNFIADAHDVARRDLHDGVLQTLAALRMRLLLLTKRKDVVQHPIELEIRKAVDIINLEQSRLRGFLQRSDTDDYTVNLVTQIDICVRTISLQWGIEVKLKSEEPAIPVDTESSFNIEHLLREVITNAARHAKSKSLTVTLSLKQDALMMAVIDLSQPLDGPQAYEKPELTLESASLRERLRLVNGEAYAEGLGKGTLLSIRIPMQQIEND